MCRMVKAKEWVTILEPEKDGFRSEFYGNRGRKGFKDTKFKRHYSEEIRANL